VLQPVRIQVESERKKRRKAVEYFMYGCKSRKKYGKNDRMLVSSLLNKKPPEKSGGLLVIEQKVREKLSST
jgi:hypothetical protein